MMLCMVLVAKFDISFTRIDLRELLNYAYQCKCNIKLLINEIHFEMSTKFCSVE